MRFCSQCGRQIPDIAKVCPYCGTRLEPAPVPPRSAAPVPTNAPGDFFRKNKKLIFAAAAVLAALLAAFILIIVGSGRYKAPIKASIRAQNAQRLDLESEFVNMYDGIGRKHLKTIWKIISSSENFADLEDSRAITFDENRDWYSDNYGDNFKIKVAFEGRTEISDSRLRSYKEDTFKYTGKRLVSEGENILALDNEVLKSTAERMGLSKDELKKLADELIALGRELKSANVKKGYDVDALVTVKGRYDQDDDYHTYTSVKAGGKWVDPDSISYYTLVYYLYDIGY